RSPEAPAGPRRSSGWAWAPPSPERDPQWAAGARWRSGAGACQTLTSPTGWRSMSAGWLGSPGAGEGPATPVVSCRAPCQKTRELRPGGPLATTRPLPWVGAEKPVGSMIFMDGDTVRRLPGFSGFWMLRRYSGPPPTGLWPPLGATGWFHG